MIAISLMMESVEIPWNETAEDAQVATLYEMISMTC